MNDVEQNRQFLYNELVKIFPNEDKLVYFVIYEVAQFPMKSEFYLFESLIRALLKREELLKQSKGQSYIVNTAQTVKINPLFKAIDTLDEKIRQLSKDLCLSKTTWKSSSLPFMNDAVKDETTIIDPVLLIINQMRMDIPTEVVDYVNQNERVTKKQLTEFCRNNNLDTSFINSVCSE